MTKELARTLTVALVRYLDENRPEGTMDCSSSECERLEKALEVNNLDFVEGFMEKKLLRLTEFEQALSNYLKNDFEYFHTKKWDEQKWNDVIRTQSKELLAIAKKELLMDDKLGRKHLEGYIKGREETMREMSDFLKSHFNSEEAKGPNPPAINIPTWTPPCYIGGPCTNPLKDCINCPRTNVVITASGTSELKAEG